MLVDLVSVSSQEIWRKMKDLSFAKSEDVLVTINDQVELMVSQNKTNNVSIRA